MLREIYEFFSLGKPMTPAASWFLIGVVALGAVIMVMLVAELHGLVDLSVSNVREHGFSGIWYALLGKEVREIRQKSVITVSKSTGLGGFKAVISDGREQDTLGIIVKTEDSENYIWQEALQMADGNETLFRLLKPDSRVVGYFTFHDIKTEKKSNFLVVYLKYVNEREIEDVLNEYFRREFRSEIRRCERGKNVKKARRFRFA